MLFFKVVAALSLAICATALPGNLQSIRSLPNDQGSIDMKMDLILDLLSELTGLKDVVQRQEVKIAQLEQIIEGFASKDSPSVGKQSKEVLRSCEEIRLADPSSTSGSYWINPDGSSSIAVHCDMSTGTTFISHDSEAAIDADRCIDPGCYNRPIAYNATVGQMAALAQISKTCRQFFRFDCLSVPLEFNGVQQAWWTDRHGDRQFFWAGSNDTEHTCQCGIEGNCVLSNVKCNCDTSAAADLSDQGYMTNKELLPVTKLNFGRTAAPSSYGRHTLGKLECTGKATFEQMPESCDDLWKIGHTLNGFYDVKGDDGIRSVFCNFNKLPGDQETSVGVVDVQSTPVYFYVQRNTPHSLANSTIPFEIELLNIGGGMNASSGVFTAPKSGIYQFSFHGHNANDIRVKLYHNSNFISSTFSRSYDFTISLSSTLALRSGDTVSLRLHSGTLFDNDSYYTNFNGILLREEVHL